MTTPDKPDFEGWLDLCRDPAQEGLYFLGPRQSRITFYSQQVRALRLAQALVETNRLKPKERVAVVGAGAAGVTAAMGLALAGAEVVHYSSAAGPFQLQSASPRLLHPHVYEWPELGSLDNRAGLPVLDWTADPAGDVVKGLTQEFQAAQVHLGSRLVPKSEQLVAVARVAHGWELTFAKGGTPSVFSKVVLAMGFGEETILPGAETVDYWSPGALTVAAVEAAAEVTYLLSGKGDGGLTDLMALLVKDFQHITFAEEVLGRFTGDTLTRAAETVFAGKVLDDDMLGTLDEHVRPVLEQAEISAWLQTRLRTDRRVTLNSAGPLFAFGRAARLNQVLAYAVLEAAKDAGRVVTQTTGKVASITSPAKGRTVAFKGGSPGLLSVDRAILRHGPDTAARYAGAQVPYEAYRAHLGTTLASKPELAVPPRLEPDTFAFFEQRRFAMLVMGPQATDLKNAAIRREATVVIGTDEASHRLYERGALKFAEIAERCERGDAVEIHLICPPSAFPSAKALIRLAAASAGRVTLTAGAAVQTQWASLSPLVVAKPEPAAKYGPVALPDCDLDAEIDACLLRLLDGGLAEVVTTKKVASVGAICTDIAGALNGTWANWRKALEADAALRSRFLRWLYSVDPSGQTPWTGAHAAKTDLVAALVYILATHLGEALHPAVFERGNLGFGDRGVALGSGCRSHQNQELRDRTDAAAWGVEALILAGASEVDIVEPFDRLNADAESGGLRAARQVRSALIQNSKPWSHRLATSLDDWKSAVETEFSEMRRRQKAAVEKVMKP